MKKISRFILIIITLAISAFLIKLWIPTTEFIINKDEYSKKYNLPYNIEFAYYDYIYGGIVVLNGDNNIILSSGTKIMGEELVKIKQLISYAIVPNEKVVFKILDSKNKTHYVSVNKNHSIFIDNNFQINSWKEIYDILRWLRFNESIMNKYFNIITIILFLTIVLHVLLLYKTMFLKKEI
jgi:hypothetical protein